LELDAAMTDQTRTSWGADSEHGLLTDVLLVRPDHFRWLPTSPISQATLDSDLAYDSELAARQHAEMVACYAAEGVRTHFLEPDPSLPYQVFARDSSTSTPEGTVVLQPSQPWRRGEYAPVVKFCAENDVPVAGMITAGSIEGGDVMIVEPGSVLIGESDARTSPAGALQMARIFQDQGWEARVQPFPSRYVHMDVIAATLGEKLMAVCTEVAPAGLLRWLTQKGVDVIDIPEIEAFGLGVNAMPLGPGRVLSAAGATTVNAGMRSRGITVLDPDLSMFTAGGGGPHCLGQALRREPCL
jgi:arginine deiminase